LYYRRSRRQSRRRSRAHRTELSVVVLCFVLLGMTGCRSTESPVSGAATGNVPLDCAPFARAVSGVQLHGAAADWWPQAEGRYRRTQTPGRKRSGLPPLNAPAGWPRRRRLARPVRSAHPGDPCQLGAPSGERGRTGDRRLARERLDESPLVVAADQSDGRAIQLTEPSRKSSTEAPVGRSGTLGIIPTLVQVR
jgi:hypothetical protein